MIRTKITNTKIIYYELKKLFKLYKKRISDFLKDTLFYNKVNKSKTKLKKKISRASSDSFEVVTYATIIIKFLDIDLNKDISAYFFILTTFITLNFSKNNFQKIKN